MSDHPRAKADIEYLSKKCASLEKEIAELKAKIANLSEITTPMKAECMGEFKETYEVYNEREEDYHEESIVVSWPNMKDIYVMMLNSKLKGE